MSPAPIVDVVHKHQQPMRAKRMPVRQDTSIVRQNYKGGEGSAFISARGLPRHSMLIPAIPKLHRRVSPLAKSAMENPTKVWRDFAAEWLVTCAFESMTSMFKYVKSKDPRDLADSKYYLNMAHNPSPKFMALIKKRFDEKIHRTYRPH